MRLPRISEASQAHLLICNLTTVCVGETATLLRRQMFCFRCFPHGHSHSEIRPCFWCLWPLMPTISPSSCTFSLHLIVQADCVLETVRAKTRHQSSPSGEWRFCFFRSEEHCCLPRSHSQSKLYFLTRFGFSLRANLNLIENRFFCRKNNSGSHLETPRRPHEKGHTMQTLKCESVFGCKITLKFSPL